MKHKRWAILLGLVGSAGVTAPAQAAIGAELLPLAVVSASLAGSDPCRVAPALGPVPVQTFSKTAALLGGRPSQLELIASQQLQGSAGQLTTSVHPAPAEASAARCAKAAAFASIAPSPQPRAYGRAKLDAGDFLQSKRLPVSRTSFDSDWNRVRASHISPQLAARFSGHAFSGDGTLLASVNRWANANVRYAEDRDLYGKSDHWADASTTLQKGAGDCEDIAIVKMQLLAAAGVPRSSMYLTIARDLARNADHAVLIVKQGDRHWLLDNTTNEVLDAREGLDYRPIMSFSGGNKWLHGY